MGTLSQILLLVLIGFSIFFLFRSIKGRPDMFSKEKFSQTLTTLGILALILIAFVSLLVMMVKP
jgi:hypothetical protein